MEVETVTDNSIQIVSFSIINELNKKKENYAVPVDQVREIRSFENITLVPKAKPFVKGVMNLRGMIIPVIDIKNKLGFGETKELNKKNHKILVADVRDSIYGIIVDNVDQVIQISSKDVKPITPEAFESYSYIRGIAKIQDKLIVLLDIIALLEESQEKNKIFNDDDIESLISKEKNPKTSSTTIENSQNFDEKDIPKELLEVFKEDEEGVPPKNDS